MQQNHQPMPWEWFTPELQPVGRYYDLRRVLDDEEWSKVKYAEPSEAKDEEEEKKRDAWENNSSGRTKAS